jgi:hypothetical protein
MLFNGQVYSGCCFSLAALLSPRGGWESSLWLHTAKVMSPSNPALMARVYDAPLTVSLRGHRHDQSAAGNEVWSARYIGARNRKDFATAIAVDTNGEVYVTRQLTGIEHLKIRRRQVLQGKCWCDSDECLGYRLAGSNGCHEKGLVFQKNFVGIVPARRRIIGLGHDAFAAKCQCWISMAKCSRLWRRICSRRCL